MFPKIPLRCFPGGNLQQFDIFRAQKSILATGKAAGETLVFCGMVRGVLEMTRPAHGMSAVGGKPEQTLYFSTHKIVCAALPPFKIDPSCVLFFGDRAFRVTANPYDPGHRGCCHIIYCAERFDLDHPEVQQVD